MDEKNYWFDSGPIGRPRLLDWRGLVVFVALLAVLICATGAESALRAQHVILFAFVMVILAIIALALAILIVIKTKPADRSGKS